MGDPMHSSAGCWIVRGIQRQLAQLPLVLSRAHELHGYLWHHPFPVTCGIIRPNRPSAAACTGLTD